MKIKVCGMTQAGNIADLARLDVDFIGFIFYNKSSRFVSELEDVMIPHIQKVGVFVNEDRSVMDDTIALYDLDCVQLHGDESLEVCQWAMERGVVVFKAVSIGEDFDFETLEPYSGFVDYFIFDAKGPKRGGNGVPFDWNKLSEYKGKVPFFLSGGIGPGMVNDIKKIKHPQLYGLDINSRFEISPGLKNVESVKQFLVELEEMDSNILQ
ncbi:phosphoribosylanthranilate isomerase [Membranihabitans maritimus]|uniref:phosphoribosylanthranilate isomerase n=1 Tax=Membranihabitans maritimus TaxID=2904244 RepID=UPI001F1EE618|nr:phosphoribosylanthranilate isomerase [Membranihabitans maritimus]